MGVYSLYDSLKNFPEKKLARIQKGVSKKFSRKIFGGFYVMADIKVLYSKNDIYNKNVDYGEKIG